MKTGLPRSRLTLKSVLAATAPSLFGMLGPVPLRILEYRARKVVLRSYRSRHRVEVNHTCHRNHPGQAYKIVVFSGTWWPKEKDWVFIDSPGSAFGSAIACIQSFQ